MAGKSNPLMVRLPAELMPRFRRLAEEFGGLPPATILRMIAQSFLSKDFVDQVSEIEKQIRKPRRKEDANARFGRNTDKSQVR